MMKIYVNDKPLLLVDEIENEAKDFMLTPGTHFVQELNDSAVEAMLSQLSQPGVLRGVFLYKDLAKLVEAVNSHLTVITAAGGLVHTAANDLLLIFRRGKWDLPKGKLDERESLPDCALREIFEETGAVDLKITKPLKSTFHTYYQDGQHILKHSHWFLIKAQNKTSLLPQTEEDIEKCEWVPVDNLHDCMTNMHSSIKDVINEGLGLMGLNA